MRSATRWRNKLSSWLGLTKNKQSASSVIVYSEPVYQDLIHREFKRSERSGHRCRILLIYRTNTQKRAVPFRSELADKTISVLSGTCRDTDYIGWYREGWILGVLLTALRPDSGGDGCDRVMARLMENLGGGVSSTDGHSLQIRMLEQSDLTTSNAVDHSVPFAGSKDSFL
jgi:hypothetical protein